MLDIKIKCPRCRRPSNKKGFRKNPDSKFNNEICWKCWRQVDYMQKQRMRMDNALRISAESAREIVLEHYGPICNCCNETTREFLEVDHINNNGAEHRKILNGINICIWLVNNNFPAGFQILCSNCNRGKAKNGGVCPHQKDINNVISLK